MADAKAIMKSTFLILVTMIGTTLGCGADIMTGDLTP